MNKKVPRTPQESTGHHRNPKDTTEHHRNPKDTNYHLVTAEDPGQRQSGESKSAMSPAILGGGMVSAEGRNMRSEQSRQVEEIMKHVRRIRRKLT